MNVRITKGAAGHTPPANKRQAMKMRLNHSFRSWALALAVVGAAPAVLRAADAPPPVKPAATAEDAKLEFKANDMLHKGIELIEQKQEERGIKMIQSVPQLFPKSKAR